MRRRYELAKNSEYQEENFDNVKPKTSFYQIPFYLGIIVLLYIGLLFGVVWHFENDLPTPLMVKDEVSKFNLNIVSLSRISLREKIQRHSYQKGQFMT